MRTRHWGRTLALSTGIALAMTGVLTASPASAVTEAERRAALVAGQYEPWTDSTGVLPDVARTVMYGDVVLHTAGQTFANIDLHGKITVKAANVTISNVYVRGRDNYTPATSAGSEEFLITATDAAVSKLTIINSTIRPTSPHWNWASGIAGHDFTVKWCNITRTVDGINVYNVSKKASYPYATNVVIKQNFIHDLTWWTAATAGIVHPSDTETHNDAIQHQGGDGTQIIGNSLRAGAYAKQEGHWVTTTTSEPYTSVSPGSLPGGGPYRTIPDRGNGTESTGRYNWGDQANLMINDNVGASRNITFTDNYVRGGRLSVNGGGITFVTGQFVGTFLRNKFDRRQGEQGAGGNDTFTVYFNPLPSGAISSGAGTPSANKYEDGSEINFRGD